MLACCGHVTCWQGAYHGKFGFEEFSHRRAVLYKAFLPLHKLAAIKLFTAGHDIPEGVGYAGGHPISCPRQDVRSCPAYIMCIKRGPMYIVCIRMGLMGCEPVMLHRPSSSQYLL